jgi:hypothetical protein
MISCQIARPVQEPEKRAADRRPQREELGNVPGSRRVHGCGSFQGGFPRCLLGEFRIAGRLLGFQRGLASGNLGGLRSG